MSINKGIIMSAIREYPLVYGDTIEKTYQEIRSDDPQIDPKKAWNIAQSIHRAHPRLLDTIKHIDSILPFQQDDNWF